MYKAYNMSNKFRAYNVISKTMSEEFTFTDWDGYYFIPEGWDKNEMEIMQCTDLLDKNGKEIYQGDIIRCYTKSSKEIVYNHEVKLPHFYREIWSHKKIEDEYGINSYPADPGEKCDGIEVIGNIYENPELLIRTE